MKTARLTVTGDGCTVRLPDGGNTPAILIQGAEELTRHLQALREAGARRLEVRIEPPVAQLRTLTSMPQVGERDLLALVDRQRNRFFRSVHAEDLVGAVRARGEEGDPIVAASVPASLARDVELAARDADLELRSIDVEDEPTGWSVPIRTEAMRERRRRRRARELVAMAWVMVVGWLVPAGAYVVDLSFDRRRITDRLDVLAEPISRVRTLEERLAAFAPIASAVARQSPDSAWVLSTLGTVTSAIPADAHLHRLVLERGARTLRVEGHGRSALTVIAALEGHWSGTVRLGAPPSLDDERGLEVFVVVLEPDA